MIKPRTTSGFRIMDDIWFLLSDDWKTARVWEAILRRRAVAVNRGNREGPAVKPLALHVALT